MAIRKNVDSVEISRYEIISEKIPKNQSGFSIVHISDLHDEQFGPEQSALSELILAQKADAVAITGDLIDRRRINAERSFNLIKCLSGRIPIYYVTGNHEIKIAGIESFISRLEQAGVNVLHGDCRRIGPIDVIGIGADRLYSKDLFHVMKQRDNTVFSLLLAHRPELVDKYADAGVDAVLCGHAHGGQFRLPLLGGLYAPQQGVLPKYTCGKYVVENTTMIVSRGLGNSRFPIRFNNPPHIPVIKFLSK